MGYRLFRGSTLVFPSNLFNIRDIVHRSDKTTIEDQDRESIFFGRQGWVKLNWFPIGIHSDDITFIVFPDTLHTTKLRCYIVFLGP